MRFGSFFIFLLLISFASFSQEEVVEQDSLDNKTSIQIEISPSVQWNTLFERYTVFGSLEANALINKHFMAGICGEFFLGELSKRIVFPNFYVFDQYKLGVVGGYSISVIDELSIQPRCKVFYSKAKWTEQEEKRFYADDEFFELRPEVVVAFFPLKRLYLTGGIGYNIVSSTDLPGATGSDLSGLNMSLGIKVRVFSN